MRDCCHELDVAIDKFIEKDYTIAIVIGGMAEEGFTEMLEKNKIPVLFDHIKEIIAKQKNITPQECNDEVLNKAKNWLKHFDTPTCDFDAEVEAINMINRAVFACLALNNMKPTDSQKKFYRCLKTDHPKYSINFNEEF